MDKVAAMRIESVKVFKINADDNPALSLWYGVQSIRRCFILLMERSAANGRDGEQGSDSKPAAPPQQCRLGPNH